jgi:hypothetical protein
MNAGSIWRGETKAVHSLFGRICDPEISAQR